MCIPIRYQDYPNSRNGGVLPKELTACGIKEYREIFFKPYRVIYRIKETRVYVMLIVEGRRDMEAVLKRRLLNS